LARRYLNQFGWTMAFAVIVSMLVSFTLTPMLSSRLLKRIGDKRLANLGALSAGDRASVTHRFGFFRWIDVGYGRMLEWSLNHRLVVITLALGAFSLTFVLNSRGGRD